VNGDRLLAIELERSSILDLQSKIALLVNATPLGMWPNVGTNPWPDDLPFPEGALVYDLVYNPPETALVRAARRAGLAAASGLGMLVEQAALALEHWVGSAAPRRPMWEAVPEYQDRLSAWGAVARTADRSQKEEG
jgi:shikimate dehydrogenase